ncbi:MAG TPA: iron ABC transporter permease, partial [Methanocorpusculum sp.]|nr:iron ABC transporter permease [Methanocorpusculum sp.]
MPDNAKNQSVQTRKMPNYKLRFILLILAALVCILVSFGVGRFSISLYDVVLLLLSPFFPVTETWDYAMFSVVFNIRLPRILAALLVGAALSTAGAAYQGMFQNPLVSPDILGASAGAGFGACLAIYLSLGSGMVTILAFAGGLIAVLVAYLVSRMTKGSATLSMVLAGILVGSLFSASTSYIKLVADTTEQLPEITYWLMGSLAGATMDDVIFAGIIIVLGII